MDERLTLRYRLFTTVMAKISGIEAEEIVTGTGTEAVRGSTVTVHFVCKLRRGDTIRSTYDSGEPDTFRIGNRDVIAGLEQGVVGMRVGGKRRLRIGPHLAYREVGAPGIPPNALLIFDVELLRVNNA